DLAALRAYHQLGVRAIHPAIEGLRGVADAASDLAEAGGLTRLGKEIIREMNRLGMVVDVSHASDKSFWDILETSEQPVVASHSNSRVLCPIPRNLSDEQVKALAQKGGVVGVHFASNFVNFAFHQARRASGSMEAFAARLKELHRQYPDPYEFLARRYDPATWQDLSPPYGTREKGPELPRATVSQLCEHLDHLVEVAGIDHVGIGSDYDLGDIVDGLHRAALLPNLTAELLRRGYSEPDIHKLWGLNFLRVFRKILG
ncbi:MAG: membrane dipeptidase, partial [Planctomycetes bacterium]|nr:membrane dipeptidase [Planctomycetota bacterium]